MNSVERVNSVLSLKKPDRAPVALHNFLHAAALAGVQDLGAWLHDGRAMADAHLAAWRAVGHDVIQLENGTCTMARAIGSEVAFDRKLPPHVTVPALKDYRQLAGMEPPDPFTTQPLKAVIEAAVILLREVGDKAYIQTRSDQGPMALALCIMDKEQFLMDCVDPEMEECVHALLTFCTKCTIRLCEAYRQIGAPATSIGGLGTSLISPAIWKRFEGIYQARYVQACRRLGLRSFTHTCGHEDKLIPDIVATGCDCLELDPLSTPAVVADAIRGKCAVLGMIDPVSVLGEGTPNDVREAAREMFGVFHPDAALIVGAGCAIPPYTPLENCQALVEAAKEFGRF